MSRQRRTRPQGSIRLTAGGMFEARLPGSVDKKRSALSGRYGTQQEAQQAIDNAVTQIRRRERVATARARRGLTVSELVAKYITDREEDPDNPLATNTTIGYKMNLKNHIEGTAFGRISVNVVTANDINKWQRALSREGLGSTQRDRCRRLVSASFNWAAGADLMPYVPMATIRKRSTKHARHTANTGNKVMLPTWEQLGTIVATPDRWEDCLLIALLAFTGLRWSEAKSLECRDVNSDGTITVERVLVRRPKSLTGTGETEWVTEPVKAGNPDKVIVPKGLLPSLEALVAQRGNRGLLFRADQRKRKKPIQILSLPNFRQRVWQPACVKADVEGLKVKDLRAFAASVLVDSGATVTETAALLRHDPRTSQKFYIRPTFDDDPVRFTLREQAVGQTMRQRLDSLFSLWSQRFPDATLRLSPTTDKTA